MVGFRCIFGLLLADFVLQINALPEQGKWDELLTMSRSNIIFSKSLYKEAQIFIQINCESKSAQELGHQPNVDIRFFILQSVCWDSTDVRQSAQDVISKPTDRQNVSVEFQLGHTYTCNDHIVLNGTDLAADEKSLHPGTHPVFVTQHDGVYVFGMSANTNASDFTMSVHFDFRNTYGYLSASDWPLLPFYGFMCGFYVILGLIWLALSFLQWRDLLRVQFWIGGVILLGMLEKATFYAEYQSINNTGSRVQGAVLFAEWVSCAKRTLARMLVIIVSLGFGIVKPRLGSTLHRVVGVGLLYFFLAASEAYLRIIKTKNENARDLLVAQVPLAVLDSAMCWWIFSALVNTTRTLRLRRNETKLALYRHFTNTLIFSVVASVFFMLYCIKVHHYVKCLKVWKDMWIEDAFWHILFSALLLVIMILWRPTNNNQRYAFVPLLDMGDDEEEEERLVSDAYGVKVRIHHPKTTTAPQTRNSIEDDLKWLEENVKSESALPILDSDEELVNTRFEVSKMQ